MSSSAAKGQTSRQAYVLSGCCAKINSHVEERDLGGEQKQRGVQQQRLHSY
jgi:hypothetical protein